MRLFCEMKRTSTYVFTKSIPSVKVQVLTLLLVSCSCWIICLVLTANIDTSLKIAWTMKATLLTIITTSLGGLEMGDSLLYQLSTRLWVQGRYGYLQEKEFFTLHLSCSLDQRVPWIGGIKLVNINALYQSTYSYQTIESFLQSNIEKYSRFGARLLVAKVIIKSDYYNNF